jgi:hypothetical protein
LSALTVVLGRAFDGTVRRRDPRLEERAQPALGDGDIPGSLTCAVSVATTAFLGESHARFDLPQLEQGSFLPGVAGC